MRFIIILIMMVLNYNCSVFYNKRNSSNDSISLILIIDSLNNKEIETKIKSALSKDLLMQFRGYYSSNQISSDTFYIYLDILYSDTDSIDAIYYYNYSSKYYYLRPRYANCGYRNDVLFILNGEVYTNTFYINDCRDNGQTCSEIVNKFSNKVKDINGILKLGYICMGR